MHKTRTGELIEKLIESVEKIEINHTIELFEKGDLYFEDEVRKKYTFFVDAVCEMFAIEKKHLFKSRSLIKRTDARAILFFCLKHKCKMRPAEINKKTGTHLSQISRAITRLENIDHKIPDQKKLHDKLTTVLAMYEAKFGDMVQQ